MVALPLPSKASWTTIGTPEGYSGRAPIVATDGDTATYWHSRTENFGMVRKPLTIFLCLQLCKCISDQWIEVDFGVYCGIFNVEITVRSSRPYRAENIEARIGAVAMDSTSYHVRTQFVVGLLK